MRRGRFQRTACHLPHVRFMGWCTSMARHSADMSQWSYIPYWGLSTKTKRSLDEQSFLVSMEPSVI
jgi:hypothetical protein